MKLQFAILGMLAISLAACQNGTDTTTSTSTDTMNAAAAGANPNMITTTTTTTTTRPAFEPKPNVQYMDLRTRKLITVRVDTVHHYIINAQTNQPVDWIMEPGTTDTIYGRTMQSANGYINYGNGNDWSYDESRASSSTSTTDMNNTGTNSNTNTGTTINSGPEGKTKIKSNENGTKVKTK